MALRIWIHHKFTIEVIIDFHDWVTNALGQDRESWVFGFLAIGDGEKEEKFWENIGSAANGPNSEDK